MKSTLHGNVIIKSTFLSFRIAEHIAHGQELFADDDTKKNYTHIRYTCLVVRCELRSLKSSKVGNTRHRTGITGAHTKIIAEWYQLRRMFMEHFGKIWRTNKHIDTHHSHYLWTYTFHSAFHSFHLVELLVCRFLHIFRNCQDYMSNKWK